MKTNSSSIASQVPLPGTGAGRWSKALPTLVRRAVAHIKHRRQVHRDLAKLAEFDDHLLADIGINRGDLVYWRVDLYRECARRPFPGVSDMTRKGHPWNAC
ncbi:DUF1127 domain-containing protein [Labrys okinawensis]|uniref:DUF1127 domain-containing protein n=1 Tax=Labrys okinawensis TaxID=346911 RepID=UPI0039BCF41A